MFCYQCEQTAGGKACTGKTGVCGKTDAVAALQDRLTGELILLAKVSNRHKTRDQTEKRMLEGLFATLTNVNFDGQVIERLIAEVRAERARLFADSAECEAFQLAEIWNAPEDIRSLKSLILFGIRGLGAYSHHALVLGLQDPAVTAFIGKALESLTNPDLGADALIPLALETGKMNLAAMELLDKGNTAAFGTPKPVTVPLAIAKGPFIVISGHDLRDLKLLLEQTEGKGVSVYTHGEMLPAHAYPELKKYPHLKGNFGTAWQDQQKEFANIPGPILFTANCLMPVQDAYRDRVFTTSAAGFPGIPHIGENKDFTPVIQKALALKGYPEDRAMTGVNGGTQVVTGFGRNAIRSVADAVVKAVKSGAIKRFLLVGGCDGAKNERRYFTELVKQSPKDTVILTLACGKYRFNDLDAGSIGGLPRIMDIGQCNDAYSAVKVAEALADAFQCGVNDLPLTLILSWYEQKAVAILLTLLHLGIKNIRLGPSLPAFVSPGVLDTLVKQFGIKLTSSPEKDLAEIVG
ncbi:MAG: hydroxylamine reductase [Spirochaetaceae bacterium]|jgi:hydroxylamine reductase|nr:hydroxylamine reductase [Spirochaetaceae bacterium]